MYRQGFDNDLYIETQSAHIRIEAIDGAQLLPDVGTDHHGALAVDRPDIAFFGQILQRLPHGGAADTVELAQLPLGGEQGAIGQSAVDDLLCQRIR